MKKAHILVLILVLLAEFGFGEQSDRNRNMFFIKKHKKQHIFLTFLLKSLKNGDIIFVNINKPRFLVSKT